MGVKSVYRAWLNGQEVGVGEGSRLMQEFDKTGLVHPAENVIMVRVHRWSSMSHLEDWDQWWLPGTVQVRIPELDVRRPC